MKSPVLLDIPESFETDRLLIRIPRAGDGPALNEAALETIDMLASTMPWANPTPTVDDSELYVRKAHSQFIAREVMALLIIHKETGLILGSSGLHHIDWTIPKFEVGYWCRKRFQGQGYITEAVTGILKFAFETLSAKRVEIRCDTLNARSVNVAERVGMKREGELRNDRVNHEGSVSNTLIYGMTAEDWNDRMGKLLPSIL